MPLIRLLPDHLKNKIAAGEVIERPAAVVRELIENSIDADSATIEVEAESGGRSLIKVMDNGAGMDKEDALNCLKRHATSKLNTEDDLYNIRTMGFRGEALPSIASVSRLTLTTALRGQPSGVKIEVNGGEVKDIRDAAAAGTSIEVRDLFYNTPARRKFMKRDSTETIHIIDAVTSLSLSHPHISFTLITDGVEALRAGAAKDRRERIMQIYGAEFLEGIVKAERGVEGLAIEAFISRPNNFRERKGHQMVFVNNRPVRHPSISHAVYSAYDGVMPRDQHPVFFVFIDINPSKVDFNVHPAKREVRFAEADAVYRAVRSSVYETIHGQGEGSQPRSSASTSYSNDPSEPFPAFAGEPQAVYSVNPPGIGEPLLKPAPDFMYLGDVFMAMADGNGLTIIDHHAAHERILYEKLLRGLTLKSQELLFPKQVRLSKKEHLLVMRKLEMLRRFGIIIEDFGSDDVIVRALPIELKEADIRGVLADAAMAIEEGERPGRPLMESVASRIACHASVRGALRLGPESSAALIGDLAKTDDPDHCPHGRPTMISYSIDDLKKLFKRK